VDVLNVSDKLAQPVSFYYFINLFPFTAKRNSRENLFSFDAEFFKSFYLAPFLSKLSQMIVNW